MKYDEVYLRQILDCVRKIEQFTAGVTIDSFPEDEKTQSAVMMQLVLIGELAKRISDDMRRTIDLPWKEIAGFRDQAIHNYFQIDLDIVWQTVQTDIPELKEAITKTL
ncbi:DUF86 domain-containing protein [Candidatus Kaiserbacteria bacterium]|nr:DUF86 domain-containing protein [Candidatus Kaiserbacteria bacterium]